VPGVVRVAAERLEGGDGGPPEQPPVVWENDEDPWEEGLPLLAEVSSPAPDERPSDWRGRATLGAFYLVDDGALPRTDRIGWLGLDVTGDNPLGRGGRADLAFEVRSNDLEFDDPDLVGDDSAFLRLDRASYAWGGSRGAPWRGEAGRFLSRTFPELGFVDGVEASYRAGGGARYGVIAGLQPALDPERSFEDSPQVAAWTSIPFGADRRGEVGIAAQKTWYDGEEDRDLVVTRAGWSDGPWRLDAAAWVDLYDDSDRGKSEGLELTEARASVVRTFGRRAGVRADASRIRFPSVRRARNQTIADDRLEDAEVDTFGLQAWLPFGDRTRWNARVGAWQDEEDDGGWAEVGLSGDLAGAVLTRWSIDAFLNGDPRTEAVGARARLSGPSLGGLWSVGLEVADYDRSADPGIEDELLGAARLGWSGEIADRWFLQLDATARFGDEQSAASLDVSLSRSL
jgi:hypothetical protein